ncbi:MAG: valine--tRNA ligase, partial [Muribaculum sp.]|nr:valine--tRNA ligase [Muribaculum sp.]
GESIMYARLPEPKETDNEILSLMNRAKDTVVGIRAVRAAKQISPRDTLALNIVGGPWNDLVNPVVSKLANVDPIQSGVEKDPAAAQFMVDTTEFNIPVTSNIDVEAELARLNKDLAYYEGFLASVMKKLSNERFVNNAPAAVVEAERRKQADAEAKISSLKASIQALA